MKHMKLKCIVNIIFVGILVLAAILFVNHFKYAGSKADYHSARHQLKTNLKQELNVADIQDALKQTIQGLPLRYKEPFSKFVKPLLDRYFTGNTQEFKKKEAQFRAEVKNKLAEHEYAGLNSSQSMSVWANNYFNELMIIIGLLLSIFIFSKQWLYGEDSQEALSKLVNKSVFKEDRKAVEKKFEEWIKRDESTKFILFYFPYSIIPGFWVDPALFHKLYKEVDINTKVQFLFIGPAVDCPTFSALVKKVAEAHFARCGDARNFSLKKTDMYKVLDLKEKLSKNDLKAKDLQEEMLKLYEERLDELVKMARRKNNVNVRKINLNDAYLPQYPLILRGKKQGKELELDMIIIDTHKVLELNGATDIIRCVTQNKDYRRLDPINIVTEPPTYIVELSSITNLLVQTLIDTVLSRDHELKEFLVVCK